MSYFGAGAKITPSGQKYFGINSPDELYAALSSVWKKDTCAKRMRGDWSPSNKTCGQCSITAFLAQKIFGGRVFSIDLGDGSEHLYNEVGGVVFDLTSEQFKGKKLIYALENERSIDSRLCKTEWAERFALLSSRLSRLCEINEVFADNGLIGRDIGEILVRLSDEEYKDFSSALIPNVDRDRVLGVRSPHLKTLSKRLYGTAAAEKFLNSLPHFYQEENVLHAYLVSAEKDPEKCIALLKRFIPFVDNWAVCDVIAPTTFIKNKEKLLPFLDELLSDGSTYSVRYALCAFMRYFLGEDLIPGQMERIAGIVSDEYYINTAAAWYFATALCKNYDAAIVFFEKGLLTDEVHNRAIQKATESLRIANGTKNHLRSLKRK